MSDSSPYKPKSVEEMSPEELELTRRWVETWKRAGPELQRIKDEELANYNHEEHWPAIDQMLQWAHGNARPRTTSGLIEMQKYFMKWRKQLEAEEG